MTVESRPMDSVQQPERSAGVDDVNRTIRSGRVKIHQIKGHQFSATLLRQPSFCSQCKKFIWYLQ